MATTRRRAAYFQLNNDSFGRPFDDGIIRALLAADYDVDIYAPGGERTQTLYPPNVQLHDVEFRRGWLTRNLQPARWRHYSLFLGNPDLGTAMAGIISRLAFRPFVNAVDEVYAGGYDGSARGYWKDVARWAA